MRTTAHHSSAIGYCSSAIRTLQLSHMGIAAQLSQCILQPVRPCRRCDAISAHHKTTFFSQDMGPLSHQVWWCVRASAMVVSSPDTYAPSTSCNLCSNVVNMGEVCQHDKDMEVASFCCLHAWQSHKAHCPACMHACMHICHQWCGIQSRALHVCMGDLPRH